MKKRTKTAGETRSREFSTVAQLAGLFHLNPMTIYRIVKSGDLMGHQIGRITRFRRNDVEDSLTNRRVAPRKLTRH